VFSRLNTIPTCDRRTDGQTRDDSKSRAWRRAGKQESPLPLTDPRDAGAQRMLNIPYSVMV